MSKNTDQGKGKGKDKSNEIDKVIYLASNAVTQCISSDRLEISKNYPFIILLTVFYFTVSHSHNLIMNTDKQGCNDYIQQSNYDEFISSFVYWIISFILIIIIKYNGLNLINNFVINGDFYSDNTNIGDDYKSIIERGVSIVDYFISGITSIMNIYFIFLLFITLYKIISNLVKLIQCNSKICTKSDLCKGKDLSKVRYYSSSVAGGPCFDKHFEGKIAVEKGSPLGAFFDGGVADKGAGTPLKSNLTEDLYPYSIREIINFWTFGTGSNWGDFFLFIYCLIVCWAMVYYVWKGVNFKTWPGIGSLLAPFVLFILINMGYLINGMWNVNSAGGAFDWFGGTVDHIADDIEDIPGDIDHDWKTRNSITPENYVNQANDLSYLNYL